jgi:Zn-dependent peptidase ImmA (M78 family)
MIARLRLKEIQSLAREKLIDHKRMHLPVCPKEFAEYLEILVEPFTPPQEDISGYLMRLGNSFGIGYSTGIRSEGFQNFTVAHELGHYFIDGHATALLSSGKHLSRSGYISKDPFEAEADAFATELLMPWCLIDPLIRANGGGFSTIKAIAEGSESSLLASAIRYAEVTKECVAVVVSHVGAVEFMTASASFKQIRGLDWLRKSDSLPVGVPTRRYSTESDWIRSCQVAEEGCRLFQWFPGTDDREAEEDVVGLGSYGRLLTVLVTVEDGAEEEEDEGGEDDYIDRWNRGIFRGKR